MNGPVSDPPAVTVLMTVYNGLPYLREAVESVLNQTFADFEFLIVDDASTDGSVACLRSYQDPRLRLVCNSKNAGQATALNQGLSVARGEYIARLDQDDVCLSNRLQRQLDFLKARPDLAGAGTWLIYIGPDGRKIGFEPGASDLPAGNFGTFAGLLWTQATPVGHPTVMIRRRILQEMGGYEQAFAPAEDFALWTRLGLSRRHMGVVPEPLVKARIHPRQQSVEKKEVQRAKGMQAHQRFIAAFCGTQENPEEISTFLRMDEVCWARFRSGSDVRRLHSALERTMARACRRWKLSPVEERSFRRRVDWWLARGALLGVLRKQYQSALLLFLLRQDIRVLRFPSVWAYPIALILSSTFQRWWVPWMQIARRQRGFFRRILHPTNSPDCAATSSHAAVPEKELSPFERLAGAIEQVRAGCPGLAVLALPWMQIRHPIHPAQQELIEEEVLAHNDLDRSKRMRGLHVWAGHLALCLLYAAYLAVRVLQWRIRLRREIQTLKHQRFDVVAKTWSSQNNNPVIEELDFYYGDLQKRLKERSVRMLTLLGDSSGKDWHAFHKGYVSTTYPWRLPELCLVPPLAPFQMVLQQFLAAIRLRRFAAAAQDPLVQRLAERASRDSLSRRVIPMGLYYWIGRVAVRIWKPKAFVTLYEGQPWEVLIWRGVKAADFRCQIVGYQHTVVMPHSLAVLSPGPNSRLLPVPDLVLCLGETSRRAMAPGHDPLGNRLVSFGTFRRTLNGSKAHKPQPGRRTVLVVPETGVIREAKLLFDFATRAASRLPDHRFIFRCHPLYPLHTVRRYLDSTPEDFSNIEISSGRSMEEDFVRSSTVLYRGSSTVLYAILHGLKPIYFEDGHLLCVDPLFPLSGWRERVCSVEEMEQVLRSYASASEEQVAMQWREAFEYADAYAAPVDEGSVDRLLAALSLNQPGIQV